MKEKLVTSFLATEKRCCRCESIKPLIDFDKCTRRPDGRTSHCKQCHRKPSSKQRHEYYMKNRETTLARNRTYRKTDRGKAVTLRVNKAYEKRYPERRRAREIAKWAKQKGDLIVAPCEKCGTEKDIHAHHDNYSKPLEVRWLCRKHHDEHHSDLRAAVRALADDDEIKEML